MKTTLDQAIGTNYKSVSQRIRVLTEHWVDISVFCPNCGHLSLRRYPNNQPVADFYCSNCEEDYELKSKQGTPGARIVDGAYGTMIERLTSSKNPNFFLLSYDLAKFAIVNFLVIPKHFFVPEIIEKRKPLAKTARRAGWTGCNILLSHVPETGKIFFVRNQQVEPKDKVIKEWKRTLFLREEADVSARGWLVDVMRCVEKVDRQDFTLNDVYAFEGELSRLHPDNRHVKDKIRQQLQILRDKGYLQFINRGSYRRPQSW